jgi:hypothetical protein
MSTAFKVTVHDGKFLAALKKQPVLASREMRRELKIQMKDTANLARRKPYHLYTTRSGNLERSTMSEVDTDTALGKLGLLGSIYVDLGIAIYARRIHEGGGNKRDRLGRMMTNKPDRFLVHAMEARKDIITNAMGKASSKALRLGGLK